MWCQVTVSFWSWLGGDTQNMRQHTRALTNKNRHCPRRTWLAAYWLVSALGTHNREGTSLADMPILDACIYRFSFSWGPWFGMLCTSASSCSWEGLLAAVVLPWGWAASPLICLLRVRRGCSQSFRGLCLQEFCLDQSALSSFLP